MTFTEFGPTSRANVPEHNRLRGLDQGDPHPQYADASHAHDVADLVDTGWISPTLLNSWTQGPEPVSYRRIAGIVYLKGKLVAGTTALPAFTLPAGYRPDQDESFITSTNTGGNLVAGNLTIEADGDVIFYASGTTYSSLAGVVFVAGA